MSSSLKSILKSHIPDKKERKRFVAKLMDEVFYQVIMQEAKDGEANSYWKHLENVRKNNLNMKELTKALTEDFSKESTWLAIENIKLSTSDYGSESLDKLSDEIHEFMEERFPTKNEETASAA